MSPSRLAKTLTVSIDRPAAEVYAFVSDAANLPHWATAFVKSIRNTSLGWIAETIVGTVEIEFVPPNEYGVADHFVRLGPGVEVRVPMRVLSNNAGSEVLFTLFQTPDMDDDKFAADAALVAHDLQTLKTVLEQR